MRQELAQIRVDLARLVDRSREDLSELEEENRRLRRELQLVSGSSGRRALLALRRATTEAWSVVRHPLWALRTLGAWAAHSGPAAWMGPAWARLWFLQVPLQHLPFAERRTGSGAPDERIRWIGPLQVGGVRRAALLCHPDADASFRAPVAGPTRVRAWCAIAPQMWTQNVGGVAFELRVSGPDAQGAQVERLHLNPGTRWRDRRWRLLSVTVPEFESASKRITVTLSTRVPTGAGVGGAWAVWGDPVVRRRRRGHDVRRLLRLAADRLRHGGLRSVAEALQAARPADDQTEAYQRWVETHSPSPSDLADMARIQASFERRPRISVVTPVYNTEPRWLRACIESVRRQTYPEWELCLCDDASTRSETVQVLRDCEADPRIKVTYLTSNAKISAASNAALALASGEFVALLDHDDELAPDALFAVVQHLNAHPDTDLLYSDEDKLDAAGRRCDPHFKPDWSPELFHAYMYTCHLTVARRSRVEDVGGFRVGYEGAQDYDLWLRLVERGARVAHVPRILYHWRKVPHSAAAVSDAKPWALDSGRRALESHIERTGMDATISPGPAPGLFRLKRRIVGDPLVSLVIPTRGLPHQRDGEPVDLLAVCLRSVIQKTAYRRYEIVLVADHGRLSDDCLRLVADTTHRVVPYDASGPFNFSRKINVGVASAEGSHILLFNDDLEVMSTEWLSALLEYSQEASVGAVGAKLVYPDGRLQHVGILIGVAGIAAHAFHQHHGASAGYFGSAIVPRNCTAVTGACLMTRRDVYERLGGLDDTYPGDFQDVDYCLRLRQAGYRVVYTPYAQLVHHESASFGPRLQDPEDIERMRRKWGPVLERDPYYNPNLTRDTPDYRLA